MSTTDPKQDVGHAQFDLVDEINAERDLVTEAGVLVAELHASFDRIEAKIALLCERLRVAEGER